MTMLNDILSTPIKLETRSFLRVPFDVNLSEIQFDHPALYLIYFNTCDFYVGCTKRIKNRINQHRGYLRSNTHINKILQEKYDTCGENNISIFILTCTSKKEARDIEIKYLEENYNKAYCLNIASTLRGFTYGERLNKLRAFAQSTANRIKVSTESRERWKDPVYRKKVLSKIGEGITVDNTFYYSVREASRKTKISVEALNRNLKNGIVNSKDIQPTIKPVMAEGIKFNKISDAAKAYGIRNNTMTWRLKSLDSKWREFYYL